MSHMTSEMPAFPDLEFLVSIILAKFRHQSRKASKGKQTAGQMQRA